MSGKGPSKSQAIYAHLRYPVIDSDGHWREFEPIAMDYLRDCAGPKIVEKWTSRFRGLGQGSFEKMSSRWDELERSVMSGLWTAVPEELDDFEACKIERTADIADLFVPNFYFGCEPDDPTVTYAFAKANPFGVKLGAVLSSDISHFDVLDTTEVLEEGWELVEEKGMSEEEFQAFTFGNPVKLWASLNPDFFKGTVGESQLRKLQAQGGQA